jgi:hypothetical protein
VRGHHSRFARLLIYIENSAQASSLACRNWRSSADFAPLLAPRARTTAITLSLSADVIGCGARACGSLASEGSR